MNRVEAFQKLGEEIEIDDFVSGFSSKASLYDFIGEHLPREFRVGETDEEVSNFLNNIESDEEFESLMQEISFALGGIEDLE